MFTLKIHTVDFPQPLHSTSAAAHPNDDLRPAQLMGVAHLFHQLPSASAPAITVASISARTTLVFVVAVPNYLSADEFLLFCGKDVSHFQEILFLRNDAMEDRYSVLIKLENQMAADGFYCSYNGRRFEPTEVEVCHIYFTQSVEYTDSAEIASIPPPDYTELPSCPVCLERLDPDTSGIQSTLCDHSFHCSCVSKWTYLSCPVCQLCQQQDEKPACAICGTFKNLWICLICGFVGCGRYEKGHASEHWSDKHHHFSLDLEKQQIWDYVGDRYVHRLNQSKADGKSVVANSRCSSVEECGTCGYGEDEGLAGALFSSKIEGILDEYNHLLSGQLDEQRQQYETLLAEAKIGKESSIKTAVEKAIFSKTLELEYKWEKYTEEERAVSNRNQELTKKQVFLQKKFKEVEEREKSRLKSKDEHILDLQEQIRDLKVYVEAQKMVTSMADSDSLKGGTLLPVESNQLSSGNAKRREIKMSAHAACPWAKPIPLIISVAIGTTLCFFIPRPSELTPEAWQLLSIFLSTIAGLVLSPLPVGAWAFLGLTAAVLTGTLPFSAAFSAFTNEVIWLIVISFFFARGFVKTGLGERIAMYFVKWLGKSTLGLSYGLTLSEALIAPAMPSTTARAGGVFLPIIQSLSLSAGSKPGDPSMKKLGSFLVQTQFQSSGNSSALFLTAAAQNLLCLKLAEEVGVVISNPWVSWFQAASLPAFICLLTTPLILYKLSPPEIKDTPDAPSIAAEKLQLMGPLTRNESIMITTMLIAVSLWIFGGGLGISNVVGAMLGLSILLLTGVVDWDDCLSEKSAWDTFAWFAVLVGMAEQLTHLGIVSWMSNHVSESLVSLSLSWPIELFLLQFAYFSIHYMFASQTGHVGALYSAFLAMHLASGVPGGLAAFALAYNTSLFGALTHYSSGQAAVYFGAGYMELQDVFKFGFIMAVVNLVIWGVVGTFCAFGLFDGLHCGNMVSSNGLESFKQSSLGFGAKDGFNTKSASALFSGEGDLLLRSASSNVACNALISDVSAGVEVQSDAMLLGALSADSAPITSGFPVESDEFDLDLPSEGFSSIPEAIEDIYKGKMVVVVDDEDRENEGDLIMAASKVTPETMAFFVKHGTGIVCVSMKSEDLERLQLPLMVNQKENEEKLATAFTISVDGKHGTSTGVSAHDRAITIKALASKDSKPDDFNRPGHIFPLKYREGGVLKRAGHTEAAVDLAVLAGLEHAGVLCEIVDDDGSMARLPKLRKFAQQENLKIVSIADLIRYRRKRNRLVELASAARIPTMWGPFTAYCYRSILDGIEHIAMVKGEIGDGLDILVRVHSECLTGDIFGSARCDCGKQLALAMQQIEAAGRGVLIYLRGHEGRGIGLGHKLRAYNLQDDGRDTVEANDEIGLPIDSREYGIGAQILRDLGVRTMKLMTNNPANYSGLKGYGLAVVGRVPLVVPITRDNERYPEAKHSNVYGLDINGRPIGESWVESES
ncbi:GTP cyclohydrolase II [Perilla frutescens var. hirtella]|nr:GTP cyclohydrolase II [Perilla frutescens var. hirtella]KAH6811738.1 GTP cyclohydrolase II [Perilla frutescens var. frutescens]